MKLKFLVGQLVILGLAGHAVAQTAPASGQRITITGSSIKRITAEGALPVEIITADDMERSGVQTAEQLLNQLGANAAGADSATSNNNVFGADTDRLTGGSANANLRGLGPASTLVLLNGRRVAAYGMSGGAVDLNTIPTAALARVEILKDGASAIYGADAIGGVINFILKTDFQGVTAGLNYAQPFASGGGTTRRLSLTAGKGSLDRDGYNVMASLSLDKNDILRGKDRSWADGFQPERGLSPNSSSSPVANVINVAGTALGSTGGLVGADTTRYTRINPLSLQGNCDAVETGVQFQPTLWNASQASSRYLCNTDYGRQYMLRAPQEGYNLVTRGALNLGSGHTAFLEATASRTEVMAELTPSQFSSSTAAGNNYPVGGPHYLDLRTYGVSTFNAALPIAYRWRMQDFGNRVIENVGENQRVLIGAEGDIGAYSYRVGVSQAQSKAWANLHDGYAYVTKLNAAMATGKIDPWVLPGETQSAEALSLIESTKARGKLGGGKTGLTQADASISGELMKLPAGMMAFAAGVDFRKETYEFAMTPNFNCVSGLASTNTSDVLLCPGNTAVPEVSRNVTAVYGELQIPVFKGFDVQAALRSDRYSGGIGASTNPKVAFSYRPVPWVLVRGSVNTGFRAPSFQQMSANIAPRDLTSLFNDPTVTCPNSDPVVNAAKCGVVGLDYTDSGNPDLKPETSKQGTLGLVLEPMQGLTVYADYWRVDLKDRIRKLTVTDVITYYAEFADRFVRDQNGNVSLVKAGWINAAGSSTHGLDWGAIFSGQMAGGKWTAKVDGTYMIGHKEHIVEALPYQQYVGTFGTRTLYLRNKLNGSLSWSQGDWSASFTGNFKSSYADQNMAAKGTMPAGINTMVSSYTVFGLFGTYRGFKGTSITVGVKNLFDKEPPFTHHDVDDVVGAGWDPRVADPLGRTFTMNVRYTF